MKLYLFSLFVSTLFSALVTAERKNKKLSYVYLAFLILTLVLISGFRVDQSLYSDEYNYRHDFQELIGVPFFNINWMSENEPGFTLFNWFLANTTHNSQSLILLTSIFINIVNILFIYKYSNSFVMSMFIYVAGGSFFTSMNIIRQYFANAIVLCGFKYIQRKEFFKYALFVIVAVTFHNSALLCLFYYFILNIELENKYVKVASIIGASAVMFGFSSFMQLFSYTTYGDYIESYATTGYGVGWVRIIFWGAFAVFIYYYRKKIFRGSKIPRSLIMSYFLSCLILLMSRLYVFIARLDYFSISNQVIVPEVRKVFNKNSKVVVSVCIYFIFFIYGLYLTRILNIKNLIFTFL